MIKNNPIKEVWLELIHKKILKIRDVRYNECYEKNSWHQVHTNGLHNLDIENNKNLTESHIYIIPGGFFVDEGGVAGKRKRN